MMNFAGKMAVGGNMYDARFLCIGATAERCLEEADRINFRMQLNADATSLRTRAKTKRRQGQGQGQGSGDQYRDDPYRDRDSEFESSPMSRSSWEKYVEDDADNDELSTRGAISIDVASVLRLFCDCFATDLCLFR